MKNKLRLLPVPLTESADLSCGARYTGTGHLPRAGDFSSRCSFCAAGLDPLRDHADLRCPAIPALDARPILGAARNRSACGADHDPKTYKGHYSGS